MKTVAFVTDSTAPDIHVRDQLVIPHLNALGTHAVGVPWDAKDAEWGAYDAVVVRSAWNYPERVEAFKEWIRAREREGSALWNSACTLLANLDKQYILDLHARGIPTVPTVAVRNAGDAVEAAGALGWERVVIKPRIGNNGRGVAHWNTGAPDTFEGDRLLQPFVDAFQDEGEYSVIVIDGSITHGVLKIPAQGEFRANRSLGARVTQVEVCPEMRELVHRVMSALDTVPLYARVDAVRYKGSLALTEWEMVEPGLFFDIAPESARAFAEAIQSKI